MAGLGVNSSGGKATSQTSPGYVKITDGTNDAIINADGQLHVVMEGKVDTENTTTTPLEAGDIFTGGAVNILPYSGIAILIGTDQVGILTVQYSPDGSDWHAGESYDLIPGADKFFTPPVQSAYYRLLFNNGPVDQGIFYIHPVLKKSPIKWSSHNIDMSIVDQDDAELVKAVITGKKVNGDYDNVSLTNGANMKVSLEEIENDISENSNTSLRVTSIDGADNIIDSHSDADGGYHLGTSVIQTIISSTNNVTTINLASGATFTGTAEETFGVNGIQVFHAADKDCMIYIDQSIDNTFVVGVLTDSFSCLANTPCSRTFTSVAPYYRARVKNIDTAATTMINFATGMTPITNPLPRALSDDARLKTEGTLTGQQNTDRHVWVSPTNAMTTTSEVRLVGTNFDGQIKDTNFWTESVTGSGTVTQDGEIQLDTGVTANSTASYTSIRKARFVVGSANHFIGAFKFVTAGTINNVRRCGAYLVTDGFFFQLDGTVFSVGTRKNSTDTLISSGSFNGNYGVKFTPTTTDYYKLDIEWTPVAVFFYINGVLLHKVGGGHLSDILTLPVVFENINDLDSIVDVAFDCLGMVILREGELVTNPIYYYHALGTETGVNLKIGAGVLHRILINNIVNNSVITISDGLTGVTDPIMVHTAGDSKATVSPIEIGAPFSTGLRLTVETQNASLTLIYE